MIPQDKARAESADALCLVYLKKTERHDKALMQPWRNDMNRILVLVRNVHPTVIFPVHSFHVSLVHFPLF